MPEQCGGLTAMRKTGKYFWSRQWFNIRERRNCFAHSRIEPAKPEDIMKTELKFIDKIGLRNTLRWHEQMVLASMIKQMKLYALAFSNKELAVSNLPTANCKLPTQLLNKWQNKISNKNFGRASQGRTQNLLRPGNSREHLRAGIDLWNQSQRGKRCVYVKMTLDLSRLSCCRIIASRNRTKNKKYSWCEFSKSGSDIWPAMWIKIMMTEEAKLELGFWCKNEKRDNKTKLLKVNLVTINLRRFLSERWAGLVRPESPGSLRINSERKRFSVSRIKIAIGRNTKINLLQSLVLPMQLFPHGLSCLSHLR